MEDRLNSILQKGKILNEKELEIVGQEWIRRFLKNTGTDKLMPYHNLRGWTCNQELS